MPKTEEVFDFSAFNSATDMAGLMEDLKKADNGESNYREVPDGNYEVKIEKCRLKMSKAGNPMVSIQFRILSGEYQRQCIFYNQTVHTGYGLHRALEFLRSLEALDENDVDFKGDFNDFRDLITDIGEAADEAKLTYELSYSTDNKGYKVYSIESVFEPEE